MWQKLKFPKFDERKFPTNVRKHDEILQMGAPGIKN